MKLIQLNTRPLPEYPDHSCVFPYLLEDDRNGSICYRLTFLADKSNLLLAACLEQLDFVPLPDGEVINAPNDIGLGAPLDWCFFVCGDAGSFVPLTDDSGGDIELRLSRYLIFEGLTNDPVTVPTKITVVKNTLHKSAFRTEGPWKIRGQLPKGATTWMFQWAEADNTENDTRVSFRLPIEATGDLSGVGLGFDFVFSGMGGAAEENWHSGTLRARDVPIVGGLGDRLYLGNAALELHKSGLRYEADPNARLDLKGIYGLQMTLGVDILYVRFAEESVTIHSYASSLGTPLILSLQLEFPLVMGPITGGAPEALALMIPLLDDIAKPFLFRMELSIGGEWEADETSIAFYDSSGRWKISEKFWEAASGSSDEKIEPWPIVVEQLNDALELGGFEWSLSDLFGDALGPAKFHIGPDPYSSITPTKLLDGVLEVPTLLSLSVGGNRVQFTFSLLINLRTLRLSVNKFEFHMPPSLKGGDMQVIDLGVLALFLPNKQDVGGDFDFETREFVLKSDKPDPYHPVKPIMAIPGGLGGSLSQRLLFELQPFSPDAWPAGDSDTAIFLRINSDGLSLNARVITEHQPNVLRGTDSRRALGITPLAEREDRRSEIVIIDNVIRKAVFFGELEVPSVDDLVAKVEVGMRQERRGRPPTIYAEVDLDKTNGKPIAGISAGYLQMQIDDLRARLEWNLDNDEWDLDVFADASLFLSSEVSNTGGLDDLKDSDRLQVKNCNLLELHNGVGEIALSLARPLEFKCLDEKFLVTFNGLSFRWGDTFVLMCDEAMFAWLDPGALEVSVEVGGVHLEFFGGARLKMRNPDRIGIDVTVSDSVRYRGEVAWVDNGRERYFAAAGTLAISGLPEAATLLKLGTGRKQNGQIVPNIVLYGSLDYEVQLFSGVVAKNFGAGIGINNRLNGIPERPTAEAMLPNIDRIDPSKIAGWSFVERNGFYLSIVGTTIIASNKGGNSQTNAYVAYLLLSIDVDLNIVAAGKVWLASSVDFVRQRRNWNQPALVGAVAILPRDRLLTAAIESRPRPAIETSKQLQEILNKGHVKLSFTLSPSLVDFFLQDISYRDEFLGVQMLYRGSFRLAYFDSTLLVRAQQMITGSFSKELSAGPGGFNCRGDVAIGIEYGGLLTQQGIAAYGLIAVQITLDVSAWIRIEFSRTIGLGRWKKRISFGETFELPSTQLDLGLRGAVAFDEHGQFGFAGEISINVPICGYRLSISPSLAINDGIIKDVRQRVAVYEGRLEAYRQQLLTGEQSATAVPKMALFAAEEGMAEWLHYQTKTKTGDYWHLIIPPADETWFTPDIADNVDPDKPIPFLEHVKSICVKYIEDNQQKTLTLLMPWDQENQKEAKQQSAQYVVPNPEALEDVELMMAETVFHTPAPFQGVWDSQATYDQGDWVRASDQTYWQSKVSKNVDNDPLSGGVSWGNRKEAVIPLKNYKPVSDPRVESADREYWLDIDQVMLPEGVLPVRMKTAEQILQSGEVPQDFNSTYGRLAEYAWWSQRAIVQRRHQGADISEIDDLEHRRAVILFQLLTELRELSTLDSGEVRDRAEGSAWQARKIAPGEDGEKRLFGLVFKHKGELPLQVRVTRSNGENKPYSTTVRLRNIGDKVDDARSKVHLLPLRQEFVVDDDSRGRLRVRLPVRYEDEFLKNYLPVTSHFQVWRRVRGEIPVLIADQQLPPVTFLRPEENEGQAIAVVDPYLATDEFQVDLNSRTSPTGSTNVEYAIKLIPIGDFDSPSPPLNAVWQRLAPYLPEDDDFPVDLAMAMDVESLYRPNPAHAGSKTGKAWTQFRFVSISGEKVTPALMDHWEEFEKEDPKPKFEIWVEERPISDSGFYAGAAEEPGLAPQKQDADVRQVSSEDVLISLDDKFRIDVVRHSSPGLWSISDQSRERFREGFAYLFYVRSKYESAFGEAFGRVRPLRHFLSRRLSVIERNTGELTGEKYIWTEPPRLRAVGRLEWIDAKVVDEVKSLHRLSPGSETPNPWQLGVSASVRPFDDDIDGVPEEAQANQRRRIGIRWNHPGWQYGGVDLSIRDTDDSKVVSSRVCETCDADIYQQAIRDFSNDSAWRLTRRERSARLSLADLKHTSSRQEYNPQKYRVNQTLYLKAENPALRELSLRTDEFRGLLETAEDWAPVSVNVAQWVRALNVYDRSPLNLNDPFLEALRMQARALIRYLFLGLRPPSGVNVDPLTSEVAELIDQALNDVLVSIDEYQPDAADFDNTEDGRNEARAAFLDADFARKLAAIVRRRRIIGEDVLATVDDPLPRANTEIGADEFWLPRGAGFEALRRQQGQANNELLKTFPFRHVQSLLDWLPDTEIRRPVNTWAGELLIKTLNELKQAIQYNRKLEPDWERREKASKVVGKAAGLTIAVKQLERQLAAKGLVMERRPHHRVIVRTDNDGTKVPETLRLKTLLSSADRATDTVGEETGSAESSIVALFNLYERMGFAVDIAATDGLGQTVTQRGLLDQIRDTALEKVFEYGQSIDGESPIDSHYVYVLLPREPDSEYRGPFPDAVTRDKDYAWVGSAFVRLAVVPKRFHDLVLVYLDGEEEQNTDESTGEKSTDLRDWLTMRGIETANSDEISKHIASFARTLAFVHPRDPFEPKKLLPMGHLLQIRLTPLELHYMAIPHLDGFAHVDWELPDRHGHRFEVSARKMSRYELLLRWADNAVRPRLQHAGAKVSVRRVMTRNDGIDLPIPQPVSVIPHPTVVQFALTLAPAGIRSILNGISAVRTGYQGYSLSFRSKLVDHRDENLQWKQIRKAMVVEDEELEPPPPILIATPRNNAFDTRLYRHERLVQLDDVPYFYEVSMDTHSLFEGDLRGQKPSAEFGLSSIPQVDPARRLPSIIAYRQPVVRREDSVYEINVILSRMGELARPQELNGGIPIEKREYELVDLTGSTVKHQLWDEMLPDPALGYHFYNRVDDEGEAETSKSVYRSVVDLLMPWHPGYSPPPPGPNTLSPAYPLVRSLESDVNIKEQDQYPPIRLRHVPSLGTTVPVVTVRFTSEKMFGNPEFRRVQVSCRGRLTPATNLLEDN